MEISVVCKYNQARSIVGAATVRKFYPDATVHSAGITALAGGLVPASIRAIAESWKLPIAEIFSTPVKDADLELSNSDLILGADEEVTYYLRKLFPKNEVHNLQETATALEFTPHDPSGMNQGQTEIELAKVVALTIHQVRTFFQEIPKHPITSYIPRTPASELDVIDKVLAENGSGFILDLNLRTPETEIWKSKTTKVHPLTPGFLQNLKKLTNTPKQPPMVICSAFESIWPESIWTDPELFYIINALAEIAPISLVTAPLIVNQKVLLDAYLSSIGATSVRII